MGFFSNLFDSVKRKQAEIRERREFLDMVEEQARPIRRKAYLAQPLREVVGEGIAKAKEDAEKKVMKKKKTEADFGIEPVKKNPWEMEDPYKFLDPKKKTKSKGKKKK